MEEKICSKCREPQDLSEFYKITKKRKNGQAIFQSSCKACIKKYREDSKDRIKKYQQDNKEIYAKNTKKYNQANKDKVAKQRSDYYQANKEKISEKVKKWHESNPGYLKKWHESNPGYLKKWREANREKSRQQAKERYQDRKAGQREELNTDNPDSQQ